MSGVPGNAGSVISKVWRLGTNLRIARSFVDARPLEVIADRTHAVATVLKQYGHRPEEFGMRFDGDKYVPPDDAAEMETFRDGVVSTLHFCFVERAGVFADNMNRYTLDAAGLVDVLTDPEGHVRAGLLTEGAVHNLDEAFHTHVSRASKAAKDFPLPDRVAVMVSFSRLCIEASSGRGAVSDELFKKVERVFDAHGVPKTALRNLRGDPLMMRIAANEDLRPALETTLLRTDPNELSGLDQRLLIQARKYMVIGKRVFLRMKAVLHRGRVIEDQGIRIRDLSDQMKLVRKFSGGAAVTGGAMIAVGAAMPAAVDVGTTVQSLLQTATSGGVGVLIMGLITLGISHLALREKK